MTQNPAAGFDFLVRNTSAQADAFRSAFSILQNTIGAHAFPACALAVTLRGELIAHHALGHFTYDPASPLVTSASIFDLASVTKVVATATMAMILYERGLLDLEAPVTAIVPEFAGDDSRRRDVSLRMLLAHSSGLPAYEKLFLRAIAREDLLARALGTQLTADPGTRAEYSDIGFIILGVALERLADETLDAFCQREIFGPLGMSRTTFNPPKSWRSEIVPTADECGAGKFRGRIIQGEVQDENASVLGGVAGHAGLFSTAVGWDTPSTPSQSGKYFGSRSFGHLGYTGTSLWIDRDRQLSVTLLTNRTWPDCQNQAIKQVRPAVHDAVIEALKSGGLIP